VQSITTRADRVASAARPCLPLCVMIGLAIDGVDIVGYHRKKHLQPLIRAHFSPLAIVQDALNGSGADPA